MTMKEIALEVAKREGKKVEIGLGNIKEVLAIISDLLYADKGDILETLYKNGKRRAKKA